jgi:hypothetical protein
MACPMAIVDLSRAHSHTILHKNNIRPRARRRAAEIRQRTHVGARRPAAMGKSKENSRRPGVGVGGLISCWVRGVDTMLSGPVKIQYANTNYFRKFTPTN